MKRLSILIPVYNVEKYLRRCLDSVYSQIDETCEIIIIDDGSTDNCSNICDEYAERYPLNSKVVHKENEGAYCARNELIAYAHGQYVWLIDPDDYVESGSINKIFDIIKQFNEPEIISLVYRFFNDSNYKCLANSFDNLLVSGEDYLLHYFPDPYLWSKVYKRKFLIDKELHFNNQLYTQGDWLFNMYAFSKCHSMVLTDIYAYNYYKGNPTSTLSSKDWPTRKRAVDNTLIAVREFDGFIKFQKHSKVCSMLKKYQNYTLAGFLYSFYLNNFPVNFIKEILTTLQKENLFPIGFSNNIKANLFLIIANQKWLFLFICRLHLYKQSSN